MMPSASASPSHGGWSLTSGAGDVATVDVPTAVSTPGTTPIPAIATALFVPSVPTTISSAPTVNDPPQPPMQEEQQDHQQQDEPGTGDGSKRRTRSSPKMVRVTHVNLIDKVNSRNLVRCARLAFEALRGAYQRQDRLTAGIRNGNRPDMRAYSKMLKGGNCLHRDAHIIGNIPGIFIGDAFFYRTELCVVGLHCKHMAGICFVPASLVDEGVPIATSIVSSGGYLDDQDNGDILYYTGSGGRDHNSHAHYADQTLNGGNLALHNSYQYGIEVRIIRGHDCDDSPSGKVYIYDGLYRVIESTFGPGKSGHDVCKFKLLRVTGQVEMGSKIWHEAKKLKDPSWYISLDLSKGGENFCVPVFNKVNDNLFPLQLEYIVRPVFPVARTVSLQGGCHCGPGCDLKCRCQRKNNGGGPVYNADGTLVMGRPVVYECGALCGCPMTCINRVTQRGLKHRLEVFYKTDTGSWALRTLDLIKPGSFVCEYSGDVVVRGSQLINGQMEGHAIINPMSFPPRWREWGDTLSTDTNIQRPQFDEFAGAAYLLDVSQKMNVAGYIGHSCTPNVFLQFVVHGNEDESFPHMMLFAMDTIPPMRELTIDYGTCNVGNQCPCAGYKATILEA